MLIKFPETKISGIYKCINLQFVGLKENKPPLRPLQQDTVTFKNRSPVTQFVSENAPPSLEDFTHRLLKSGLSAAQLAELSIKPENRLGSEGAHAKVYAIPYDNFEDYAIKEIFREKDIPKILLILNVLKEKNYGQPIHQVSKTRYVLKRVRGQEHSISNWRKQVEAGYRPTTEDAGKFLIDVKKIAAMPDKSYTDYASKLKYLHDNGFNADTINPNNLLIDYKHCEINFVDITRKGEERPARILNYADMAASLLDFVLFKRRYDVLDSESQKQFIELSNQIVQKCYSAAEKTGLSTDKKIFEEYTARVDSQSKKTDGSSLGRYFEAHYVDEFQKLLNLP